MLFILSLCNKREGKPALEKKKNPFAVVGAKEKGNLCVESASIQNTRPLKLLDLSSFTKNLRLNNNKQNIQPAKEKTFSKNILMCNVPALSSIENSSIIQRRLNSPRKELKGSSTSQTKEQNILPHLFLRVSRKLKFSFTSKNRKKEKEYHAKSGGINDRGIRLEA